MEPDTRQPACSSRHSQWQNFTPTCGDFVAVLLVPTGGQQPIAIAQVTFASLGISCADSNVVTAVLNGVEFPASAQILWTVNKVNETASLDDDQKLDWPTTVSADTTFTYQDPDGITCSTNPADYNSNGIKTYNESNTAVLVGLGKQASASTAVNCYLPLIDIVKTTNGADGPDLTGWNSAHLAVCGQEHWCNPIDRCHGVR